MKNENKLKGRDLINIGVFGAIYFVILFAVAMLGMIPIFLPLLSVLVPIVGGIPFMLFLTKVKKIGMIFIMAMIMGILMLLTGMGPWPLLTCAIAGGLAEISLSRGDIKVSKERFYHVACSACGFLGTICHYLQTTRAILHREQIMVRHTLMLFQNSCQSGWLLYC